MGHKGKERETDHSSAFRLGAMDPTLCSYDEEDEADWGRLSPADNPYEPTGGNRSISGQTWGRVPNLTPVRWELSQYASDTEASRPASDPSLL